MGVVLPIVRDVGGANALASVIKERCRCHEVHVATIYACVRVVRVSQREGDAARIVGFSLNTDQGSRFAGIALDLVGGRHP